MSVRSRPPLSCRALPPSFIRILLGACNTRIADSDSDHDFSQPFPRSAAAESRETPQVPGDVAKKSVKKRRATGYRGEERKGKGRRKRTTALWRSPGYSSITLNSIGRIRKRRVPTRAAFTRLHAPFEERATYHRERLPSDLV